MLMNIRLLISFLVCVGLCWSAKSTIPLTSDDMVTDDSDTFKPRDDRVRTTTTRKKPSTTVNSLCTSLQTQSATSTTTSSVSTTTVNSTCTSLQTQSVTSTSISSVSTTIKPVRNTATGIKQLVDKGNGSEHYELLEFVGSGSSGRVYRARPLSTRVKERVDAISKNQVPEDPNVKHVPKAVYSSQWVAVKVIKIESETRNQIAKELRIMRHLEQHPHLVHFISAHLNKKDNTVWIAMGWIEGKNLGRIVDDHADEARRKKKNTPAFDEEQTMKLATPLFDALSKLHSLGSTHGDIDVSNIMVSQGVPVLIDVGDGHFEADKMGMDIFMLTFALVECSVKPVDTTCDGPIPFRNYDSDRRRAIKKVLNMVAKGSFKVPDGVRTFVKDIVKNVKDTTTANDPFILQHPFLNNSKIEVQGLVQ